jgi:hypothetical protein
MPGFVRDLAAVDPWDASLQRSRSRRARTRRALSRRHTSATQPTRPADPFGLAALLRDERRRDLAAEDVWQLSLGRSRARRRAAELRFVPTGSLAKRISLGALAALTAVRRRALRRAARPPPRRAPNRRRRPNTRSRSAPKARGVRSNSSSARSASPSTGSTGPKPNRPYARSSPRTALQSTAS